MTIHAEIYTPPSVRGWDVGRDSPAILIVGCIGFNFLLCFVNANIMPITAAIVILSEMVLIGLSVLYGFRRLTKAKTYWLCILSLQIVLMLVLSAGKHELLMKPLRDLMIMPVFVVLGLAAYRLEFTKILLGISVVIGAFALAETFMPQAFLSTFNFKSYFVAKGAMEDLEWLSLNTFASGIRPGGRFLFDLPGVHRISSVFLEPVSLGFYAFISALYFTCIKSSMTRFQYAAGIFISFLLIWLSDARMALGCLMVMLLFRPVFAKLDHKFSALVIPFFLFSAYVLYQFDFLSVSGEGVGARIHSTMVVLSETDLSILLGLSSFSFTADSALADLLQNTGIMGILLLWLAPIFFLKKMPERSRIYMFGISIYIGFGFLLSPAIYSIKTAALLWFLYGYLLSRDFDDRRQNA